MIDVEVDPNPEGIFFWVVALHLEVLVLAEEVVNLGVVVDFELKEERCSDFSEDHLLQNLHLLKLLDLN